MKKELTFDETCKVLSRKLNMSPDQILEAVKDGKLNTYVKIDGILRRFRIDGWEEDGTIRGNIMND